MNNVKNKKIYKRWASIYDVFFGSEFINKQRESEISMLNLKSGDKVLFIEIGTGEDLKFIPQGVVVTGIDITEKILDVARNKAKNLGFKDIKIINMDGQNMEFDDNQFDYIILNLILSVIPDGNKCLKEAYRILKPEGKIAVFDKFLNENRMPNIMRRFLNIITRSLGTDINRKFSDMLVNLKLNIVDCKSSILGGVYKIIIMEKY